MCKTAQLSTSHKKKKNASHPMNSMVQSPTWEAYSHSAGKEILWLLCWAIKYSPHPISFRCILVMSTHVYLGIPCSILCSGFLTKFQDVLLNSPKDAAIFPTQVIVFDLHPDKGYSLWSCPLHKFLQPLFSQTTSAFSP